MKRFGLGKTHKLCSKTAIDRLFSPHAIQPSSTALAYPLRAVWGQNNDRATGEPVQFLISVPKKRLRHAVDRVTMRRRIREAYRLNRHQNEPTSAPIDIAFVYISDNLEPYSRVEKSMQKLLQKILSPS